MATVVLALVGTGLRTPTYESKATILVTPSGIDPTTAGLPILTDSVDPTRTLQTATTILDSPKAAVVASSSLDGDPSAAELLGSVKVSAQGDSNVVAVTAKSDVARDAAATANAYARAALSVRADNLRTQVQAQIASMKAARKALGTADPTASAQYAASIAQLEAIRDGQDPNFSLLQGATGANASGPSKMLVLILAVVGGLVIGVGAALVLDQLEHRIRDEEGLVDNYPLPVLTRVPVAAGDVHGGSPQVREAFRTLQVQLEELGGDHGRVTMFTSASVGDGKTTSAIEMAKTLVASGLRVVLLDLDLRKPDVGRQLDVSSDVLALFGSRAKLSDALIEAPDVPGLMVFSGRSNGGGTPMLESLFRQLPEMLAEARELADVVVVDTAPLGRVSDALRVAAFADDLIFVARPGNTDRGDLRAARELLEHSGIEPTGMVVVGGAASTYGYYGEVSERPASWGTPPTLQPRPRRRADPAAGVARTGKQRKSS